MIQQRVDLLAATIQAVGEQSARLKDPELNGFLGRTGSRCDEGLLVVGRAVNGWEPNWRASSAADADIALALATRAADAGAGCSMRWVCDQWSAEQGYRTNSSPFWRAVRSVLSNLDPEASDDPQWSSRLAWTNLYKISYAEGGNPSDRLCSLQQSACAKILQDELMEFQPQRVLFATGMNWARDFLVDLEAQVTPAAGPHIEGLGAFEFGETMARYVVASHPQGKNEAAWSKEVVDAFIGNL